MSFTYSFPRPALTTDAVVICGADILLIERKKDPYQGRWALPGGFIDYGERAEHAAVREAKEETGLDVELTGLVGVYSNPDRDPRSHTLSVVYMAYALNIQSLRAGDDAQNAALFSWNDLPQLAFDHVKIISDFRCFQARLG